MDEHIEKKENREASGLSEDTQVILAAIEKLQKDTSSYKYKRVMRIVRDHWSEWVSGGKMVLSIPVPDVMDETRLPRREVVTILEDHFFPAGKYLHNKKCGNGTRGGCFVAELDVDSHLSIDKFLQD